MPFMSMRLLDARQLRTRTIHTALDDLESFLWLLIWGIVHSSKDINGAKTANQGIQFMLDAWSGGVIYNKTKILAAEYNWDDAVFGDLIRAWLNIFQRAYVENKQVVSDLSLMDLGGEEWNRACNWLESYCKGIYKEVLESGFRYLDGVREYSDWETVVAAHSSRPRPPRKRRRFQSAAEARGAETETVLVDTTAGK